MVSTIPLNNAIKAYSLPENLVITGNVVSIDVAPALAMGDILPNALTNTGANNSEISSREIFEISATTPKIESYVFEMIILDKL